MERYFSKITSIYFTGFLNIMDGFITNVSGPESHYGEIYQISRPQNSAAATVKGFVVGYQQFYDFLPGWSKVLGLYANCTAIDSDTPSRVLGSNIPLENLSRHCYNIISLYEKGKYSARIAYNWRDKYRSGIASFVSVEALPVYTRAYGWLDASLIYRASDKILFALKGQNLLRTRRCSYYGGETRPKNNWINDTQIGASITNQF